MLKIVFKEPVGGMIQNGIAARAAQYFWSPGFVTDSLIQAVKEAKKNGEFLFFADAISAVRGRTIEVSGQKRQLGFFVNPDNIAWMHEYADSVVDTEKDFQGGR